MREAFAESLLLSVMGGALGLLLSSWCSSLLSSRLELTNGPRAVGFSVAIDWRVWSFAGLACWGPRSSPGPLPPGCVDASSWLRP